MIEETGPNDETATGLKPPTEDPEATPLTEADTGPPEGVPEEIWERIVKITCEQLQVDPSKVQPTSTLEDLGADSLDRVEFTMEVEEQLLGDQKIPDDELEKVRNLGEFAQLVVRRGGKVPSEGQTG